MDLGRPKKKISWNNMKPTQLCLSHRFDSVHIILFANGRCMRKLSHSNRFPKQTKSQLLKG
jgi:hypothetical protein